ncbi:MAG: class I SAM-dependent methyltransferase [Gammaproteobacteria bacterium]
MFGDRARYGKIPIPGDKDWEAWKRAFVDVYYETQKQSVGALSNEWGYSVMSRLDLTGKHVIEIGPGQIEHMRHWKGKPASYTVVDVEQQFTETAARQLSGMGVDCDSVVVGTPAHEQLMSSREAFDVMVSFYAFEHIHPLEEALSPTFDLLKRGGALIGGIPAEGGLAWGVGRFLTTRRMAYGRLGIDYDKVICWEHVNYASDVLNFLTAHLEPVGVWFHPFRLPIIDINAIISFMYRRP